jgi:hypothetical protein
LLPTNKTTKKLMALIAEIDRLLEQKQLQKRKVRPPKTLPKRTVYQFDVMRSTLGRKGHRSQGSAF